MTKPLPDIEPCPFCGDECIIDYEARFGSRPRQWYVTHYDDSVFDCQYRSGNATTERKAILAHNKVSKAVHG